MKLYTIILETVYEDCERSDRDYYTLCCVTEDKVGEVLISYKKRLEQLAEIRFEETETNNFEFYYDYKCGYTYYSLYSTEVNTFPDMLDKVVEDNLLSEKDKVIEYTYNQTKELKNERFRSLSREEQEDINSDKLKKKEFVDNISKEVQLKYRGFYVEPKELYEYLIEKEREEFIDNVSKEIQSNYRGLYIEAEDLYKDLYKDLIEKENIKKGLSYTVSDMNRLFKNNYYVEDTELNKALDELKGYTQSKEFEDTIKNWRADILKDLDDNIPKRK